MINKYWTAIAATANARDGIEILGGNGTVEDFSAMPRLYVTRSSSKSWEGTHNTCAPGAARFRDTAAATKWLDELGREIGAISDRHLEGPARGPPAPRRPRPPHRAATRGRPADRRRHVRSVVDRMCRLTDGCAHEPGRPWELERNGSSDCLDALELYRLCVLDRVDRRIHPR